MNQDELFGHFDSFEKTALTSNSVGLPSGTSQAGAKTANTSDLRYFPESEIKAHAYFDSQYPSTGSAQGDFQHGLYSSNFSTAEIRNAFIENKEGFNYNSKREANSSTLANTETDSRPVPESDKKNKKRARNREAAKKSREKKKDYIRTLEKQVYKLTASLRKYEEMEINMYANNHKDHKVTSFDEEREELIARLKEAIEQNYDELSLRTILDSLQLRMGVAGTQRKRAIHNLFTKIVELSLPSFVHFLFSQTQEDGGLFAEAKNPTSDLAAVCVKEKGLQELLKDISVTDEQLQVVREYRERLIQENLKFAQMVKDIKEIEQRLMAHASSIQDTVDLLRDKMTSRQIAKWLLWMENEPYGNSSLLNDKNLTAQGNNSSKRLSGLNTASSTSTTPGNVMDGSDSDDKLSSSTSSCGDISTSMKK
mmetsp:Transcript_59356/g.67544  ORF Transcript_59356/g.67544 Transcript_59356/m.67544 type:complete len:424 (+) Transcript_59356:852-2123(+)|eukprot:CAMPEP_0114983192 /NCGR_PEP_ID=MMETSP0216-20121206/6558_1 /TAXON_ID=223996 /ORGANISM="Protocruzia adherens, Strain Boccale" /LENGTH=423 /DNA_ID=CAMNT_0002345137 /DNA_START=729 /DNA_END=2000 /DNA_ORIENTATION=-